MRSEWKKQNVVFSGMETRIAACEQWLPRLTEIGANRNRIKALQAAIVQMNEELKEIIESRDHEMFKESMTQIYEFDTETQLNKEEELRKLKGDGQREIVNKLLAVDARRSSRLEHGLRQNFNVPLEGLHEGKRLTRNYVHVIEHRLFHLVHKTIFDLPCDAQSTRLVEKFKSQVLEFKNINSGKVPLVAYYLLARIDSPERSTENSVGMDANEVNQIQIKGQQRLDQSVLLMARIKDTFTEISRLSSNSEEEQLKTVLQKTNQDLDAINSEINSLLSTAELPSRKNKRKCDFTEPTAEKIKCRRLDHLEIVVLKLSLLGIYDVPEADE